MKTPGFNEDLTHLLVYKLSLGWLILLCGVSQSISAQVTDAKLQIENLKRGTLYVVLPTYRKKLAILREQQTKDLSKNEAARIAKHERETVRERDNFGKGLMNAFDQAYKFSDYDFIQDQAVPGFLQSLKADQKSKTFFLDHGSTENGASALIISNHLRQPLSRPMPYFARTGRSSAIFEAFFGTNDLPWRDLTKVIVKLDQRLLKYYEKYY